MVIFILLLLSVALQIRADSWCFVPDEMEQEEDLWYITNRQDCIEVARLMISGDKAYAPMKFTRKENVGFQVPHVWALKGSCYVGIDMVEEDDEETFSLAKMALNVAAIIHDCVDNPDSNALGGKQDCGPHLRISILVAGKNPDDMGPNITMANARSAPSFMSAGSLPPTSNFSELLRSRPHSPAATPW